ncbi:DUF177 domain-containing protein [Amaricoccus sp.]|uniref:YceD family protein n=1 Tax=Amaricoccus sp. TaxID=1872485 RepID=UPI001B59E282|nr:DUF177 domain-containing protein [Amaricoccus sp.]MBP7000810.1 DUF177 domain-containing protein [Amaricoccus sp.]
MPEIVTRSAANPEFPRVVEARGLRGLAAFPFDVSPDADEAAAIARLLGAQAVRKLRLKGRLAPAPGGAWGLEATLGATVVQTCVVTLEPVTTRIDTPVRRIFTPDAAATLAAEATAAEIELDPDEDDEIEPLGDRIDLGVVAIEALALALPPYPRREGAELGAAAESGPPGAAPLESGEVRPFAALAALRGKPGEDA